MYGSFETEPCAEYRDDKAINFKFNGRSKSTFGLDGTYRALDRDPLVVSVIRHDPFDTWSVPLGPNSFACFTAVENSLPYPL